MPDTPKTCAACGAKMFHRNPFTGTVVEHTSCNNCDRTEREKKSEQNRIITKQLFLENIVPRLLCRDFPMLQLQSVISKEIPASQKSMANEQRLPCLVGEAGSGKTWQAVQLAVIIASQVEPVNSLGTSYRIFDEQLPMFLSAPDLAVRLRSTFGRKGSATEQDILEQYSKVSMLVIDDLGAESTTEYSLATIYALINGRYTRSLRTIITTNLPIQELARRIGDRCVSRIFEMCFVIELEGPDRRLKRNSL